MKNTALILAGLLLSAGVLANDEPATIEQHQVLTLAAAANIGTKDVWVETEEDVQLRLTEDLADKADVINAKISTQLEQQLEAKLAKQLDI